MRDSETELDKIFLSYNKILKRLKINGVKTKNGKEITHKDLRKAILVMQKKHPTCRWRSDKVHSRKYYILSEGYYWLLFVFFQNEKNMLDADIDFFEMQIKEYEKVLNIKPKNLFSDNIPYLKLESFFNRKIYTIKRAIRNLEEKYNISFQLEENNQMYISSKGIELLCKECFKQKYLEILEKYKMELTEKYIAAGFPYDNFFHRN